ncbi:MAG: PKD domain-containing protein [Saprospiraceae bacterium]
MKQFFLFLTFFALQQISLHSQCDDPNSVFVLATTETYFCESTEPVVIDNKCDENNPLACIQNMVLDWGDGSIETLAANDFANKSHIYFFPDSIACMLPTAGQKFIITLRLNFIDGKYHDPTIPIFVEPLPRAFCSANPNAICLNPTADVTFNGSQSCHEMTYEWDFGEPSSGAANTSTIASPTHTYSTLGNHTVRLIVTNGCGADTCYTSVQATNAVAPAATFSPTEICVPGIVAFQNSSQNAISYEWIITGPAGGFMFVNGTTKFSTNPFVQFTIPGNYQIQLKATGACDDKTIPVGTVVVRGRPDVSLAGDMAGCLPNFQPDFNATLLNAGNSTSLQYFWEFPGGSPASAITTTTTAPTVTYTTDGIFTVRVIAENECGRDTAYWPVSVAAVALAGATFTPAPPGNCGPYTIEFTNTSTGSGGVFKWTVSQPSGWMFVDSTTENSPNPHILFTAPGNYVVTLMLPNALCGGTTTWSQNFTVKTAPTAMLPDSVMACVPADVVLDSEFSNGGFAGVLPNWDAPGATPPSSTAIAQTFHYDSPGVFNIAFSASNACGNLALNVVVILAERAADASVSGIPANNCGPFTAVFSNQSSGTGAGSIFWTVAPVAGSGAAADGFEFVGGTSGLSDTAQVLFKKHGQYAVSLHFAGLVCGLDSTWTQIVEVKTRASASFDPVPDDCAPKTVIPTGFVFDDGGDPAASPIWTANGAVPPSSAQIMPPPIFQFDSAGDFALVFVASNVCGDTTLVDSFTLTAKTPIEFAILPDSVCKHGSPVAVSPNPVGQWAVGGNLFNAANEFLPENAAAGWNPFEHHVGSGNCLVTRRDSIFVIDPPIDAGEPQAVCDTLDCVTFTGLPITGGVWTSSAGSINPVTGQICAAAAGFGTHTIWHSLTESVLGCFFRDSTTLAIYPKPVSLPDGPLVGCVNQSTVFENNSTGFDTWAWHFGGLAVPGTQDSTHVFPNVGTFPVFLLVGNAWCADTNSLQIQIVAPPTMAMSLSDTSICPQEGVVFHNLSTGDAISGFQWNLGGQVFNGFEPLGPIYFLPGTEDTTYTITLSASGVCPDATATEMVLVHPLPYLKLTPSHDSTCSGDTLQFTLGTTGGTIFNITFSAADTFTQGLPLPDLTFFTPNDSTNLTVMAIATGQNICAITSDTAFVEIVPNEANAFCDLSVPVICVGDTLFVTNGATPLGAQVFYDFGDGTTSADPNPRKVYDQPGTFKIRQTARTFCGYDFVDRLIQVNPAPPVSFAHDTYRCAGDSMHFWLTVDSTARTFEWDFGFGNSSTALRPTADFSYAGQLPVTLTITLDSSGCDASLTQLVEIKPNPTANFTASDTLACGELNTTLTAVPNSAQYDYGWFASNGNTAVDNPANFVFSDSGTYEVRLLIQDSWGCHDDTAQYIFHVLPVPTSDFVTDKDWACGFPATVHLTETASLDALGFEWQFSDGTTSGLNNPEKTFDLPGDYLIRLLVKNLFGCSHASEKTFRVFVQPVAKWEIADLTPCQFEVLNLENLSENANRWLWTFNHADTSTAETPDYAVQQPGLLDVSLVAMLDSFCFDTLERLAVTDIKPAPVAGFYVVDSMPQGYPEGLFYIFSTAIGATMWEYDFDNGAAHSFLENPMVTYGQNIRYAIQQIVTNEWGCADTARVDTIPMSFGGLYAPNAFAPDTDGGDYAFFMPKGRGLARYRVRVFAPTGKLVFESEELINGSPGQRWDGNDFNGEPCGQGAYAWLIEAEYETAASRADSLGAKGKKVVEKGSLTLIR